MSWFSRDPKESALNDRGTPIMSSKAITENPEPNAPPGEWKPFREQAPSVMRADEPTVPRWIGTFGLALVLLGVFVLLFHRFGRATWIGPYGGSLALILGLVGLLYHAARDADLQVRRLYALLGFVGVAAGCLTAVQALTAVGSSGWFLPYGYPSLVLGLLFLMPVARHETETAWRAAIVNVIGLVGLACAATGLIGGNVATSFLLDYGLLLGVLGLGYLWAFIGLRGAADDLSHRVGWAVGVIGALVFLVALVRSVLPPLLYSWRWIGTMPTPHYLESSGVLLMAVGLLYVGMAGGLVSDNRFAVLTRRELAAFFFSPLAYIILFAFAAIAAWQFLMFLNDIQDSDRAGQPMIEPIIFPFIFSLIPVLAMILVVPLLTMRLMSEEKRSGTLEVLLTAPVGETPIVLSKFAASLIVFALTWIPFGLFLLGLRVEGEQSFDYRPLVSFSIALLCSGAGFIGMGLFLSALTRNQVAAGVLAAAAMLLFMAVFFLKRIFPQGSAWSTLLTYTSFIDLWMTSLQGKLALRDVMFFLSSAVFWVFLTIKVLESRKWA